MHIIGTAGHVDHGKSAVVRALTGTDPDRWIEEKLRGMTLDLGFARLGFDDGLEAGVVDVPGHERFLHNMLAGATGMELLLLVVAANEGPRPQTFEHLAILAYLNVRRAIVVLTKSDLVDAEGLSLARTLIQDAVKGTVAEGAEVISVSTVTGGGLDTLRTAIHQLLRGLEVRAPEAPAYLPIDRVFALSGHGTVVTGTLMQGQIAVGDTLRLSPLGRDVRVRSLQVFGEDRPRVAGGSRVAVNLPGVGTEEIARGTVLSSAQLAPMSAFRVTFRPYAPSLHMLRRRNPVRAYIGAAEIFGTLQFEVAPISSEPRPAQLTLREATIGLPGATFVLRRMSPKDLLGGGTFEGVGDAIGDASDGALTSGIESALDDVGYQGGTAAELGATANVREDLAAQTLAALKEDGRALKLAKPEAFISASVLEALQSRIVGALKQNEAKSPWMMGTTSLALSRELAVPEPALLRILTLLVEGGRLAARAGYYAAPAFSPSLTAAQRKFFDCQLHVDAAQPFVPVPLAGVVASIRAAQIEGLSQAFDTLVVSGVAVKVAGNVYRGSQVAEIQRRLEAALHQRGQLTPSEFRDIVGTSRKYAVPLLEWFDAMGVTVRSGDVRLLRERRPLRS